MCEIQADLRKNLLIFFTLNPEHSHLPVLFCWTSMSAPVSSYSWMIWKWLSIICPLVPLVPHLLDLSLFPVILSISTPRFLWFLDFTITLIFLLLLSSYAFISLILGTWCLVSLGTNNNNSLFPITLFGQYCTVGSSSVLYLTIMMTRKRLDQEFILQRDNDI